MRDCSKTRRRLDAAKGNLVFTGVVDDPETLETLTRMGFRDAPRAAETVRGWHFGRRAAVQTARAREVLTELVPDLLQSLAGSGDPDVALAAVRRRARAYAGGGRTVLDSPFQQAIA